MQAGRSGWLVGASSRASGSTWARWRPTWELLGWTPTRPQLARRSARRLLLPRV